MLRVGMVVAMVLVSGVGMAQEPPKPEDLSRAYQDALGQLKAAQDRKNELAIENMQLVERIEDLQRQLTEARRRLDRVADQTFFYRSHYAAWQVFIHRQPALMARWSAFLQSNLLSLHDVPPELREIDWTDVLPTPVD